MSSTSCRIVSLIPSATEIVAALGLTDCLVGRSHECDYPPEIQDRPICTAPKFNPEGSSGEIHNRVTELLRSTLSVYQVKTEILEQLQPTHIVTQAQCEVCAVSLAEVEQALTILIQSQPQIISLQPNTLADVWADIYQVGTALGIAADATVNPLQEQVNRCLQATQKLTTRPTVACIEWTEPLMAAGNWIPELVMLAGGQNLLAEVGKHSLWLDWEALRAANPEKLIFMPCGYSLDRTREDASMLLVQSEWQELPAVKNQQVYITDGNQYFNRPGPRLVDSLEILAEIIHPEAFEPRYRGLGWELLEVGR